MMSHPRAERNCAWWIFLLFVFTYTLTAPGYIWGGDGFTRLEVARSLAQGKLSVSTDNLGLLYRVQGPDGQWYSFYGLGQSLAFIPCLFLGQLAHTLVPGVPIDDAVKFVASLTNSLWGAGAIASYFLLVVRFGYQPRTAVLLSITLGLGTIVWTQTRENFDHLQVVFFLILTLLLFVPARKFPGSYCLAGAAFGAAVLTRIDSLLFLPAVILVAWG